MISITEVQYLLTVQIVFRIGTARINYKKKTTTKMKQNTNSSKIQPKSMKTDGGEKQMLSGVSQEHNTS